MTRNDKNNISKNKENKEKNIFIKILKTLKWIVFGIISFILTALSVRAIGKAINSRAPDGGINEEKYVDINNSTQWINIYGKNINNPVILYLHGGPGGSTSYIDYVSFRKWSDIYTVVTWDQRDAGLSYKKDSIDVPYTNELFMKDGLEMTKYLLDYLHKDKIILFGHSWGTMLGTQLALKYPEYYQYYIGAGQLIDVLQNEKAFVEAAKEWTKGDKEGEALIAKMDPNNRDEEYDSNQMKILKKYGYDAMSGKKDYNIFTTLFFNPYYSILDFYRLIFSTNYEEKKYTKYAISKEVDNYFSLLNVTEFPIPYYNILGDHDYQTNYFQAVEYFNNVKAPRKKLYTMKDMKHGLMFVRTKEFSDLIHDIEKLEKPYYNNNNNSTNSTTTNEDLNNSNNNTNSTTTIEDLNNSNNSNNNTNSTTTIEDLNKSNNNTTTNASNVKRLIKNFY